MGESFLITLREGFEAALIVAIVLAFVKRGPAAHMARAVWAGTAAALALAAVVGVVIHLTIDDLQGEARARTFAIICIAAAALLTWMIFWMRAHARGLKAELEGRAGQAVKESSALALALVAFTAVAREGLETALFLISTTTASSGGQVLLGGVLGLAVAVALGVAVYRGSRVINMGKFFAVTGALIILFAAGLVAKAVLFLQGQTEVVVYNVKGVTWLTSDTQVGRFLAGIFGWDPAPSVLQFLAYVGYLVPALVFFFWHRRTAAPALTKPAAAPTSASPELGHDVPVA